MSDKVVHFPRHLARPPAKMDLPRYMEYTYEQAFGEPWSALEAGVRGRHPDVFKVLDALKESDPQKKWWEFWR